MATISLTKFYSFVEDLAEKKHNLGSDVLTVALSNTLPVVTNTVLANITQISYTNLSSRVITTASSLQTTGTYKLTLNDLTLTASGAVATFRYIAIYNDTATNKELIAFGDLGSAITLASGDSVVLDFDGSLGALTIV